MELKVNEEGLKHMMEIHKDASKIRSFVCEMMIEYRKLSEPEASEEKELDKLMKKLEI